MDLLIIIVILLLLFGGGGYYGYNQGTYVGGPLNIIWMLVVVLLIFAVLQFGGFHRFY